MTASRSMLAGEQSCACGLHAGKKSHEADARFIPALLALPLVINILPGLGLQQAFLQVSLT